jgi:hypothetical protein
VPTFIEGRSEENRTESILPRLSRKLEEEFAGKLVGGYLEIGLHRDSLAQARLIKPLRSATKNRTRKMKKRILAIPAAATAMPAKPKMAAIIAITRKASAHRSMLASSAAPKQQRCVFEPGQFGQDRRFEQYMVLRILRWVDS